MARTRTAGVVIVALLASATSATAAPTITEFSAGLTANSKPFGIGAGPDGNIWFTETANPGRIGRIKPDGTITEFTTGLTGDSAPGGIVAGPDGNIWFTEINGNRVGRITPAGAISEFSMGLQANARPYAITAGPDGNLWFSNNNNNVNGGSSAGSPRTGRSPNSTRALVSSRLVSRQGRTATSGTRWTSAGTRASGA